MAHHRLAAPDRELLGQRLAGAQSGSGGDDHGGDTDREGEGRVHMGWRLTAESGAEAIPYVLHKF